MSIKIVQIATAGLSDGDFVIHGKDIEGNLYEWITKRIMGPDGKPALPVRTVSGWEKCIDEINNPKQLSKTPPKKHSRKT